MRMEIKKEKQGTTLTLTVEGRLDTIAAPALDQMIHENIDGVKELIFDLKDLSYMASSGLRVLLTSQKIMNKQGKMVVKNVNEDIKELFFITGFADFLTIE